MNAFSIGLSALQAGQTTLDLVGQNLANATTAGYHRQTVNLVSNTTPGVIGNPGTGVDVASITRYTSPPTQTAILQGNANQASTTTQMGIAQQVQTILTAGDGGIGASLEDFFNQVTQLTSNPGDPGVRTALVSSASTLAGQFNVAANSLDTLRNSIGGQVSQTVSQVNSLTSRIATLNVQISGQQWQQGQMNNLLDQRDQLIGQLSQLVDVRTVPQSNGTVNVLSSGAPLVVGSAANAFQATQDATGNMVVTQSLGGSSQPVTFSSGTLAGQLQAYNEDVPEIQQRLDTLANTVITQVNEVQATGLGTAGSLTSAEGTVSVLDPSAPLATQSLPVPVQGGQVVVSVTNTATGQRLNYTITIDPSAQSMNDVAGAITAGTSGGVQASVKTGTNTIQLVAPPGYTFDFAGLAPNPPGTGAPVANTDTAGLLAGLGINGLFSGAGAGDMALSPAVASNPGLLASSRTGDSGDASNLVRMAAIQNKPLISGQTLSGAFTSLSASVGTQVQQLGDQQTAQSGILQNLTTQDQSVTGVNENEELLTLLGAQRMIQAASQYMSAVNTAMDSVMTMLK